MGSDWHPVWTGLSSWGRKKGITAVQPRPTLRHRSRLVALVAVLGAAAALLAAPALAGATPPPNPSDQQIAAVQQQKAALATEVGRLSGQVVQLTSRLQHLLAARELAEQKLAFALQKLGQAKIAAVDARQAVAVAQGNVAIAQRNFVGYAQAAYMNGDVTGTTGSLLTAANPSALLQQATLQQYQASHQISAVADMQRASVAMSNADAAARQAVQRQQQATTAATVAKQEAVAAVQAAARQRQALQATLSANQTQLQNAQLQLATLNNERATFLAYQAEQARLAAVRAAQQLAQQRAAEQAAQQAQQQLQNSTPSGAGGPVSSGPPPAPSGGGWTAARGADAVARAERWLGTMYAWAGGDASGPTYGVCAGDGAFNDCHIVGFDCSGLTLYAWAPYLYLDHYAANQFLAGSYHPSVANLMPGDLVFWSADGTMAGIHHVAMYVGGGNIIQAPQSGEVIQLTPLDQVSWGYYGATRPLT